MGRKPGINNRTNENRVEQEIKLSVGWDRYFTEITDEELHYNPYPPLRCEYKPPVLADPKDQEYQTVTTAEAAVAYYNRKHHTDYKFVDGIGSNGFLRPNGNWYHTSFKANSETSPEISKTFFAEMKTIRWNDDEVKFLVTSCRPVDDIKTTRQCGICGDETFLHPTNRRRQGLYACERRSLRLRYK